jgi:hypothetical protein
MCVTSHLWVSLRYGVWLVGRNPTNQATELPMRPFIACGLTAALLLAMLAVKPVPAAEPSPPAATQADQSKPKPSPQARPRGASDRQLLQNPLVQQVLRDPEMQQQIMDDPRLQEMLQDPQMQRLMQNPQLQRQMQQNQQLREMYQLQRRPLPGVGTDDDD